MLPFSLSSRSRLLAFAWVGLALSAAVGLELGCSPTRRTLVAVSGSSSSSSSGSSGSFSSVGSSSSGVGGSIGTGGMAGTGGSNDAGPDATPCSDSCGDPACLAQGYTCANNPPPDAGWIGPGYLYNAPGMAPDCGAAWAPVAQLGGGSIMSSPAVCSPCSCPSPAGGACGPMTVEIAHDSTCMVAVSTVSSPLGACEEALIPVGAAFVKGTIPATGSCVPMGGVNVAPSPPSFGVSLAACTMPTTMPSGCTTGSSCLPAAPAGYQGGVCVYQSGDVACPPGYANKTLAYQGIADSRGCEPCTCASPIGRTCPGEITYYEQTLFTGCTGTDIQIPTGECVEVPTSAKDEAFYVGQQQGSPAGGSCASDGGAPMGGATGASPTTICCQ